MLDTSGKSMTAMDSSSERAERDPEAARSSGASSKVSPLVASSAGMLTRTPPSGSAPGLRASCRAREASLRSRRSKTRGIRAEAASRHTWAGSSTRTPSLLPLSSEWARPRCGEERRRAEGEDEEEEDLGEESESEWSPMATAAAAATDLTRVGGSESDQAIGYGGESSESGGMSGSVETMGCGPVPASWDPDA